jgi:hypothetical protein
MTTWMGHERKSFGETVESFPYFDTGVEWAFLCNFNMPSCGVFVFFDRTVFVHGKCFIISHITL